MHYTNHTRQIDIAHYIRLMSRIDSSPKFKLWRKGCPCARERLWADMHDAAYVL